ncbi:hypothetical protein ACIQGZ_13520 [Streptomyces sp. NPDC092296]|uniref:hypothetical protein n=1 Tax=Streptomyces sp. NPDC092296 TaxID=3366012 RepID=UPI0038068A6D
MRALRTAAAAVAVAVLLGGTAGCSERHRERTPVEAFQAAAKVMEAAGAASIALERHDPDQGPSTGSGVLSWGSRPAMDVALHGGSGELRVRTLDGVVYLGTDAAEAARRGGLPWTKYDPEVLPGRTDPAAVYSTWSEQLNPASDLAALARVGTLRRVGEERLEATDTVHYRGAAATGALVGASGALTAAQRAAVLAAYRELGVTSITADIWINDRDEVVQERRTCRSASGDATTTTRYSRIGAEVDIQAPLPEETFDLSGTAEATG